MVSVRIGICPIIGNSLLDAKKFNITIKMRFILSFIFVLYFVKWLIFFHRQMTTDANGNPQVVPDINVYQQKKNLAQGMMDLALLSANANQLRYVVETYDHHPYYWFSLISISISLILQVGLHILTSSFFRLYYSHFYWFLFVNFFGYCCFRWPLVLDWFWIVDIMWKIWNKFAVLIKSMIWQFLAFFWLQQWMCLSRRLALLRLYQYPTNRMWMINVDKFFFFFQLNFSVICIGKNFVYLEFFFVSIFSSTFKRKCD